MTPVTSTNLSSVGAFRLLLRRFEVDAQVMATLMYRFWSVIAGGITVLLIPLCISPIEQGYYYTFGSILMLQVFFELGIGQVIIQITAHEAAHLRVGDDGSYVGEDAVFARLASLRDLLRRWYFVISILFSIVGTSVGFAFFWGSELPWTAWALPWGLLVLATGINLALAWKLAMIEGFGRVQEVNRLRLWQSIAGFGLMWFVFIVGGGLFAVFIAPMVAAVLTTIWLRGKTSCLILGLRYPERVSSTAAAISWRREIFPFQWRIAVSWISGFFIFQLFTPVIFKYHGAVEAGRIGLGITLFSSLATVSTAWVGAKVPALGSMLTHGRHEEASALYRRLAIASMTFIVIAALGLLSVVEICHALDLSIVERLPTMQAMVFIAIASLGNAFVNSAALFMRAHKEEPMLAPSVVMAAAIAIAVNLSASYGVSWVVGVYAALVWALGVPWTVVILGRYYQKSLP